MEIYRIQLNASTKDVAVTAAVATLAVVGTRAMVIVGSRLGIAALNKVKDREEASKSN